MIMIGDFQVNHEGSESDSETDDDDAEETALESYQTPLDDENSPIDEYIIFKHIFSSEYFVFPEAYPSCRPITYPRNPIITTL